MEAILKISQNGQINLPPSVLETLQIPTPREVRAQATQGRLEITAIEKPATAIFENENGILVAVNTTEFDAVDAIR